jgi:cell wall-associated NlpC family hydrolase
MKKMLITAGLLLGITSGALTANAYTATDDDTLWRIAQRNKVSLDAIIKANPQINPNNVYAGLQVNIPGETATTRSSQLRGSILNTAKGYLGIPYAWGGDMPAAGFDCSGFLNYVLNGYGITVPRVSRDMWGTGTNVRADQLQIGDLIFFENTASNQTGITHVGMYAGDGKFIHASSGAGKVTISNLWANSYYSSHFYGARRVIGN